FRVLGNIVAIGVFAGWWLALWLLPALVTVFGTGRQVNEPPQGLAKLGAWVVAKRGLLLPATLLLFLPIMAMLPRNEINDVFREWFDRSYEVRDGMEFSLEELGGLSALHFTLDSGEKQGVTQAKFYQEVAAFSGWLEQQPEVAHVSSYLPILKRMNRVLNGDVAEQYVLPEDEDLAAQYLTIYELSLPYGQSLNNLLDLSKQRARVTATLGRVTSKELKAFDSRAQQWLQTNAPNIVDAVGSGTPKMFAELGQRNIRSMLKGTVLALLLISVLLIFALRSVKIGLISMLPNLIPAALGFGLWAMISGQVNLALSVVMGMTLGIVVDDTIHFLSKYQRARRQQNRNAAEAVQYAFSTVGRALWVTSVVLVLGFLVLAFSDFAPTADMGLLTAIVIAMALFADFFFLPPLLIKLDKGDRR
ncbi:MAG: MMPL family transporter, partial [Gammaproteobacteria bacterium]|nr:MMPL family transporter [Gammaproteobacteria bacterium]